MIRRFLKRRSNQGLVNALGLVKAEYRLQRMHNASVKRARAMQGHDLRLNLGCGPNRKDGWVNVDLRKEADLQLDLREPWPFATGSVSIVYSEHFFEHLEYPAEVRGFLSESMRVLKPGGLFRVGLPDAENIINDYVSRNTEAFRAAVEKGWHPEWCDTPLHAVNYHFRQEREHNYAYDFETLSRVLEQSGFVSIEKTPWSSEFDGTYWEFSDTLYVNALTPE